MKARTLSLVATLILLATTLIGCEGRSLSVGLGLAKAGAIVLTDVVVADLTDPELETFIQQTGLALDASTTIDQTLREVHGLAIAERDRRGAARRAAMID